MITAGNAADSSFYAAETEDFMHLLFHKFLIFILILPALLAEEQTEGCIAAMLFAVILTALCSYLNVRSSFLIHVLFCAAACLWPLLFPFLPLAAYDGMVQNSIKHRYLWLLPLLRGLHSPSRLAWLTCAALCMLAVYLELQSAQYQKLLQKYHRVQDDTTEAAILLKQKNKELMKNQDYEVELATLAERNRIAREIHDNVGHLLTRSILQVSAMLVVHSGNTELKEPLLAVKDTLSDAMDNVRQSVHNLHEESINLQQQLTRLTDDFTFCPVQLTYDSTPLPKELNYTFIAIVKEALSNIARHSNATRASVSVLEHPSLYQLRIHDNGTLQTQDSPDGIGLFNMEERIRALDGNFHIDRTNGFKIFISIPKRGKNYEHHID